MQTCTALTLFLPPTGHLRSPQRPTMIWYHEWHAISKHFAPA